MRNTNSSGFRSSIGAVAAVTVTGLTLFLFRIPLHRVGHVPQPPSEELALSVQAEDHDARNV